MIIANMIIAVAAATAWLLSCISVVLFSLVLVKHPQYRTPANCGLFAVSLLIFVGPLLFLWLGAAS